MNINFKFFGILIVVVSLIEISCSFKSPYVGRHLNTSSWCEYPIGVSPCIYQTEYIDFTIDKLNLGDDGKFHMEGFMQMHGISATFKSITLKGTTFLLILAKDDTVVEVINFFPHKIDINAKFPFDLRFKSPPFDSYTFTYEFRVTSADDFY